MTETAPFITVCERRPDHEGLALAERAVLKARQGVELVTSGEIRVVDELVNASARGIAPRAMRCERSSPSTSSITSARTPPLSSSP